MTIKKIYCISCCFILVSLTVFASGAKDKKERSITVFNAASTTDIIEEAAAVFKDQTGVDILTNPASSGTLAKQLEQGAGADIYISASRKWMTYTQELGIVSEQKAFLQNRLVLIAAPESPLAPFSLNAHTDFTALCDGHLSMGDPAHVPAGRYAREALTNLGWYEAVEKMLLPAPDVRAALAVVELDEADLGIVYETDAIKSGKVKMLSRFPADSHSPITYFCALLKDASPEARQFYEFLLSGEASGIFESFGFSVSSGAEG